MKKGIFGTITGFFLVSVIVFGLIVFLSVYTGIVEIGGEVRDQMRVYDEARQMKGNLFICHGHTSLRATILNADNVTNPTNCRLPENVVGYRVEQSDVFGCQEREWIVGQDARTTSQTIVYNVLVLQENSNQNCIATLLLLMR